MTYLALSSHPDGVETGKGRHVAYDIEANTAAFGATRIEGPALTFHVTDEPSDDVLLAVEVSVPSGTHLLRCDRIDFPPGGIAYTHTHPGPGIRCQLLGELTVFSGGVTGTYRPMEPWFESGPDPVYAEASGDGPAAFVRALLLPVEWAGKRTIKYLDPNDAERPKLQKATVFGEIEIEI